MSQKLYDLTNPQKNILSMENYYNNTSLNTNCGVANIHQVIDFENLSKSISLLINQHSIFRLKFKKNKNSYQQYFDESIPEYCPKIIDIQNKQELEKIKSKYSHLSLFSNDKLYEFAIYRLPNRHGGIIGAVHHLLSDSWGVGLMFDEILRIYNSLCSNIFPEFQSYPYLNYIQKEQEYLKSESFKKDADFWNSLYQTIPEIATVPSVKPQFSSLTDATAERKIISISSQVMSKIQVFCKENKVSPYHFFMAIFAIYIGNISNSDDFVIGTPILNRLNYADKHTMGMFVSTVPFRIQLNENCSFVEFVHKVGQQTLSMMRHQRYPYQALLQDLRKKDASVPNLYHIVLSYQITTLTSGGLKCTSDWSFNGCSADDLQIHIVDYDNTGSVSIFYDYKSEKYSAADIEKMHARINEIIKQVLDNSKIPLFDIPVITEKEKNQIINHFNHTKINFPKNKTIVDLLENQAKESPNKIAVVFENQSLTYQELNERSNQLANYLIKNHIKKGDVVAILLERSLELIVGLIGILKSGACYLPLDPDYPISRIQYILENSGAKTVLVHSPTINMIDSTLYHPFMIDLSSEIFQKASKKNPHKVIHPHSLAYLMYTSGSTGLPKGVAISHHNLTNFVLAMQQKVSFSSSKVMASVTTVSFDIFGLELWCSLSQGLKVALANKFELSSPDLLRDFCIRNKVKIIQTTPSRFHTIVQYSTNLDYFSQFTDILVGGETLSESLCKKLLNISSAKIYNVYGPTETTIWSTIKKIVSSKNISIGKPIANTTCYILNRFKNLLPLNIPGELYIGGDGVCSGYWQRPDLTSTKFSVSPFQTTETIYETGDLAFINDHLELIHLGRNDFQVKIRGYRIELGEIENRLLTYPGMKECVVFSQDGKSLSCYYVAGKEYTASDLSAYLMETLPTYMIPANFIRLQSIPLTPNGKVDRKALSHVTEQSTITLAQTETEKKLSKAIASIIKKRKIDINTPFLNLGLDSLSMIRLQTNLLQYNIILSTQDFYQHSTVRLLAEKIDSKVAFITQSNNSKIPETVKHHNVDMKKLSKIQSLSGNLNNVFLTGANGFLGIHILHEILSTTNQSVFCLVRGTSLEHSSSRLISAYQAYFEEDLSPYLNNRVFIITGDVDKKNFGMDISLFNQYINRFSTIIHTAAIVKHYGNYEDFQNINVNGTENVANFAFANKKKLIHISSISVSGNYLVKQDNRSVHFSENSLDIGQDYQSNVYVNSKFQAEQIVLSYIQKGLIAQIHRIGILSGRYSDGVFQSKIGDNAFYNRIKSIILLGAVSEDMLSQKIEFTPVDSCAKAIVLLGDNSFCDNKVFHLLDTHLLPTSELIKTLNQCNYPIKILSSSEFNRHLRKISDDHNEILAPIINDISQNANNILSLNYNFTVNITSRYTNAYLKNLDFDWPIIDHVYIEKILSYMKKVKFI